MKSHVHFILLQFWFISAIFINQVASLIGGNQTLDSELIHQVSVQVKGDNICGGSIIANRFILTAASCVTKSRQFVERRYKIVAGSIDLTLKTGIEVDVQTIYVPEGYFKFSPNIEHDIAVLKLKKSLRLKSNLRLRKLFLPEKYKRYTGPAMISGYGINGIHRYYDKKEQGIWLVPKKSNKLRYASVEVLKAHECTNNTDFMKITKRMICGKVVQKTNLNYEGACTGDPGNALIVQNEIIGVLSVTAPDCNERKSHAIYTRVSSYMDFIYYAKHDVIINMRVYTIGNVV